MNAEDPICPECYWVMNSSSWERFTAGFLDGTFTVEEFENMERKNLHERNFCGRDSESELLMKGISIINIKI